MPDFRMKMEELLFDYGTTYRTDYRDGEIVTYPKTVHHERKKQTKRTFAPLKDTHTLTEFSIPIPFSLLHRPKEIIRTNPWEVQKPYHRREDPAREQALRTRPRLVMTPALSMDDIEDPRARALLIKDIYTTDSASRQQEAVEEAVNIRAPFPGLPAPANPIFLPKVQPAVVPPAWRKDSLTWDERQARGKCDPTRDFWLLRKKPTCGPCEESAIARAEKQRMWRLKGLKC